MCFLCKPCYPSPVAWHQKLDPVFWVCNPKNIEYSCQRSRQLEFSSCKGGSLGPIFFKTKQEGTWVQERDNWDSLHYTSILILIKRMHMMRCSKFDLIQIRTNWEVAHSVLLQSLWSLRFLKAGKMWLEHLRIQDIFSSLIPLIDEFYHLCTEWRGERSTVEEAELCFCLDTITRSYLDTENRVSCVWRGCLCMIVFWEYSLLSMGFWLLYDFCVYLSLRSLANHMR